MISKSRTLVSRTEAMETVVPPVMLYRRRPADFEERSISDAKLYIRNICIGKATDADFRDAHPDKVCKLTVKPSTRYYNDSKRDLPGTVFWYKGQRYVLSGQLSNSKQYRAVGCGTQNFNASRCNITKRNKGLVWLY